MTSNDDSTTDEADITSHDEGPNPLQMLSRSFFALVGSVILFYVVAFVLHAAIILLVFPKEAELLSAGKELAEPAEQGASASPDDAIDDDVVDDTATDDETTDDLASEDAASAEKASEEDSVDKQNQLAEPGQEEFAEEDELHSPSVTFWLAGLAVYAVAAVVAGWCVARFAPAAALGHGIFLAAFLFFNALNAQDAAVFIKPNWVAAAYTFGIPLLAFVSASATARATMKNENL